VIKLTALGGSEFILNAELIEQIESVPETLITLTTGRKLLVRDGADQVVEKVLEYRRLTLKLLPGRGEPDAAL